MNWLQRLGTACLVLSAFLMGATWATSVNHAVNPVPINGLGLTEEAAQATREAVASMPPLQVVGADSDEDNRRKRVCLTAALYEVNGNEWPWHGPQEIGDCFIMGTMILLPDGTEKRIEEIRPGEYVVTHRGNIRRVTHSFVKNFTGDLVTIRVKNHPRPITATADHEFVVFPDSKPAGTKKGGGDNSRTAWKSLGELQSGERILIPFGLDNRTEIPQVLDISRVIGHSASGFRNGGGERRLAGKTAIIPEHFKGYHNSPFEAVPIDVRFGRLLGLYLAEGGASECRVDFWFNRTEEFLARETAALIQSLFGVEAQVNYQPSKPTVTNVRINSIPIAEFFSSFVDGNVYTKRVPDEMFAADRSVRLAMLRGWMDGDAAKQLSGGRVRVAGVTASPGLADDMDRIAKSCGLLGSRHTSIQSDHQNCPPQWFTLSGRHAAVLYPHAEFGLWRTKKSDLADLGFALPVCEIQREPVENHPVYCITVEGDHSFIAEGYAVHNCNAFATARAVEVDLANQIKGGAEFEFAPVDRPWIYYGARLRNGKVQLSGDGSVPSWGTEWLEDKGTLFVTPDVPAYSGSRSKQWGSKGPPKEFYPLAEPYKMTGAVAIRSAQEACNAITAGYPVLFGSMQWGTNSIKLVEGRNVARDTTNWPHAEVAVTYDGTTQTYGEKGLFYIDNSWGPNAHKPLSTIQGDAPGGYYVTWQTMDAICKEGMAFSISGSQGFPKRDLNWDAFQAVGMAAAQPQEKTIMNPLEDGFGYELGLAFAALGAVLLFCGRMAKNARRGGLRIVAPLLLVGLTTTIASAGDALSFSAFDVAEKSTSKTLGTSSDCPLSFAAFDAALESPSDTCPLSFAAFKTDDSNCQCKNGGRCTCGANCECRPADAAKADVARMARPKYPARPPAEWGTMIENGRHYQWTKPNLIDHLVENKNHGNHWDRKKLEMAPLPEIASMHRDEHDGTLKTPARWYMLGAVAQAKAAMPTKKLVFRQTCVNGRCFGTWVEE